MNDLSVEDCCAQGARAACPSCDTVGNDVGRQTLLHMLRPDRLGRLGDRIFRFCGSPACETVYYAEDGSESFDVRDVRVRVGQKRPGDPSAEVCYCFGYIEGMIEAGVAGEDGRAIAGRIRELTKAGLCACEVRNPSGRCCLGQIATILRRLPARPEAARDEGVRGAHDCCARR